MRDERCKLEVESLFLTALCALGAYVEKGKDGGEREERKGEGGCNEFEVQRTKYIVRDQTYKTPSHQRHIPSNLHQR